MASGHRLRADAVRLVWLGHARSDRPGSGPHPAGGLVGRLAGACHVISRRYARRKRLPKPRGVQWHDRSVDATGDARTKYRVEICVQGANDSC